MARIVPGAAGDALLAPPQEPRLVYCTAAGRAAQLLEKLLVTPRTAALHDPHFICDHQPLLLARSGVAMPRAVFVPAQTRERLQQQAQWLGGFPVVVKRAGLEGGQGVRLAHDLDDLMAQLARPGGEARIEQFIAHRFCWRVTVLDGRALAFTAHAAAAGDFRTNAPGGTMDLDARPPEALLPLAVRATRVLRLEFGGVDVMEADDGRLQVCEVNFPCSFHHQQQALGIDIAGAIVDRLIAKARALQLA